jgi:hypothetical protein
MIYRGWTIGTHGFHTGFAAQYVSPIGQAYQTAACFDTAAQAAAFAQGLVDHLLRCQRFREPEPAQTTLAG